jgi:hypothetical protein
MPVTLVATNVPAPQIYSDYMYLNDYFLTTALPDFVSASSLEQYDTTLSDDFNRNAAYLDVLAQYGGGLMGVVHGLVVSAGTGLVANVTAGGALIGGVCQLDTADTCVLAASSTNFIWFKNDKTIEVLTGLTPPTEPSVLIGIAFTDGSGVTAVDTSGVVYCRAGMLWRETADLSAPFDTPNANLIILTKTLSGDYLWTGTEYKRLCNPLPTVVAQTSDLTEDATDRWEVRTNEGATVKPIVTLEAATAGVTRTFIIQDVDGMRIVAAAGDTIRIEGSVSASGGYAESTTIGSVLILMAINGTEWIAINKLGTWSLV